MGRIFFFLVGFVLAFLQMLLGAAVICGIVGFFFLPALYVLVPLCLISILIESFKGGMKRANNYAYGKEVSIKDGKVRKQIYKLKGVFKEDELYEFDKAWKQMSRNLD